MPASRSFNLDDHSNVKINWKVLKLVDTFWLNFLLLLLLLHRWNPSWMNLSSCYWLIGLLETELCRWFFCMWTEKRYQIKYLFLRFVTMGFDDLYLVFWAWRSFRVVFKRNKYGRSIDRGASQEIKKKFKKIS